MLRAIELAAVYLLFPMLSWWLIIRLLCRLLG